MTEHATEGSARDRLQRDEAQPARSQRDRMLADAWAALGGATADLRALIFDGPADLLPGAFPVTDLAAAAVGTSVLAARELAGGGPAGRVDSRAAATAFRSERFLRVGGAPAGEPFGPLSTFLPTADGWLRLHGNYPHHRAAALRVLDLRRPDLQEVRAATAWWTAAALEDAVVRAGGCAAAVRTPGEWSRHPAGAAAGRLPLVRLERVGDAPAQGPPAGTAPASGVRVLDLTRVIAGPVCTRTLAAYGADVLRIDHPRLAEIPLEAMDTGPGKRSTVLDLAAPAGQLELADLLDGADVVVTGYRPGALARFGLDPAALAQERPGLIVLTLSAWGTDGPWGGRRGFDSLVQAACGIAVEEARASGTPDLPGALPAQALDHATGYLAAAAVMRALALRRAVGGTWHARLALAGTAAWLLRRPRRTLGPPTSYDPDPYLDLLTADLPAPGSRLSVVRPPGGLGDLPATWPGPPPVTGSAAPVWRSSP